MNKIIWIAIVLVVVLLLWWPRGAEVPATSSGVAQREAAEVYVREHITALSPELAVLGGTYYVTEVSAEDGQGMVSYEDGHIAHKARFTYEVENGEVSITSFEIIE